MVNKKGINKKESKEIKIRILPIVLSVLAIAIIGFLIFGPQYYSDINKSNDKNDNNYGNLVDTNSITVDYNDIVTVNYELTVDGEKIDSSYDRNIPFKFTVGKGVVTGFSKGVLGMHVGEERIVIVSPEEGYGTEVQAKLEDMNYSATSIQMYYYNETGKMVNASELVGLKLYTANGGTCIFKRYISNTDIAILSCVNPPHELAGKTLTFKIKMLDIKKPENTTDDANFDVNVN